MDGWRVEGYTEVRELGRGGQGRVVLARDDASGAPVAIKYLAGGADEAERERMRHEARMLAQADSPHVARLHRLVEGEDGVAIVMEAVDGVSLKELLARNGALGPEASLTVLKGSLLGLAAAHALGVVHRDYKPANVVVPADGKSRLVDFGIAVPAGREAGGSGTAYYMAPEQWDRHVARPAGDVYSATCVFVECVSGRRPFGGDRRELRRAHLTAPVPVEAVPEPLRPLVAAGMAKSPDDRPESAAAFVTDLERTAREAYGPDWEERGVRRIAAAAAALAALFPLAAWLLPGGQAAGHVAGHAAGQATGHAAGHAAGHVAAQGADETVGHLAAQSAKHAGAKGAAGGAKGLLAAAAGTAAVVAAGTAAVVATTAGHGSGGKHDTGAPPAAVTVAAVQNCTTTGFSGATMTPSPGPAKVRLPEQVTLPKGAGVFRSATGRYLIAPAAERCAGSMGADGGGETDIPARSGTGGAGATGMITQVLPGGVGSKYSMDCDYFPDSPEAQKQGECQPLAPVQAIPTGVPSMRASIRKDELTNGGPPRPYVAVSFATMDANGWPTVIGCIKSWAQADLCTATLTYAFVQEAEKAHAAKADIDQAAQRIKAFVASAKQ
ncbi:protein kinase [Actinomadura sp. LD22]|uniref:non-specific serine/threonine protein kinase n=1 Tax=Actinomadura physcomitrii TaxID=2650748 RepID=A0A6I4MAK4_9ACTN|nr:serine/threonine-protein kinase [Actinomadura physcomitrii]MVZ99155.1 protein kinase [Actinomadura physcomitrii]